MGVSIAQVAGISAFNPTELARRMIVVEAHGAARRILERGRHDSSRVAPKGMAQRTSTSKYSSASTTSAAAMTSAVIKSFMVNP